MLHSQIPKLMLIPNFGPFQRYGSYQTVSGVSPGRGNGKPRQVGAARVGSLLNLFFAVTTESTSQHILFFKLAVTGWAGWEVFLLWATLDSSTLLPTLGKAVDPPG